MRLGKVGNWDEEKFFEWVGGIMCGKLWWDGCCWCCNKEGLMGRGYWERG